MKKKFLTFLLSLLIIFGLGFSSDVLATGVREVSGWAWSQNIGWISFNSRNCDPNGNGIFEGVAEGAPTNCPITGTAIPYGVRIEPGGAITGHAWSSNIGWIHFNPTGTPPVAPLHTARVDNPGASTSTVSGWARACTVFLDPNLCSGLLNPDRGGWDGWIRLRGTTTDGHAYGVWLDTTVTPNQFRGWAWSNMVVGWISFNSRNCDVPLPGDRPPGCPAGAIPTYRVEIFNRPPLVEPISPTGNLIFDAARCDLRQRYIFSWTFNDPGDTQSAFEIEIWRVRDNVLVYPLRHVPSVAHHDSRVSYNPDRLFEWNTEYRWRARVWDNHGAFSDWATSTFTTLAHEPPRVSFTWEPTRPAGGEEVRFRDTSTCFAPGGGTATCTAWFWDFGGGRTSNLQHPTTTFPIAERYTVRLTVTDGSGFSCTAPRTIAVGHPRWIEIPPIIWMRNLWASVTDVTNGLRNRAIVFLNNF